MKIADRVAELDISTVVRLLGDLDEHAEMTDEELRAELTEEALAGNVKDADLFDADDKRYPAMRGEKARAWAAEVDAARKWAQYDRARSEARPSFVLYLDSLPEGEGLHSTLLHVAKLVSEGYTSGHSPQWRFDEPAD